MGSFQSITKNSKRIMKLSKTAPTTMKSWFISAVRIRATIKINANYTTSFSKCTSKSKSVLKTQLLSTFRTNSEISVSTQLGNVNRVDFTGENLSRTLNIRSSRRFLLRAQNMTYYLWQTKCRKIIQRSHKKIMGHLWKETYLLALTPLSVLSIIFEV